MSQFDELPEGWEWGALGDCLTLINGRAYKREEMIDSGTPILRIQNLNKGDKWYYSDLELNPDKYCDKGDLLYAWSATFGPYIWWGKKCIYHYHIWKVVTSDIIDKKFAFYLLQEITEEIKKAAHGVAMPHMTKSGMESWSVPLPPLNEQRRIVEKIEALTARSRKARAALDEIPALLDQFRQSVLAAAFRGDLTTDWRAQNPDAEPAEALLERIRAEREEKATSTRDKSRLYKDWEDLETPSSFKVLDTWLKCSVGHIGNVCNGSTPSRKEDNYWGGSIPWVSSGEVQNNIIFSTREKITEAGFKNSSGRILPVETVLIAMIGEGKTRGQTAILRIQATINQNIAAVVLDHGLLSSQYLWHWFRYKYSETRRVGSGSGPQALNCQRVREMPFILPPLAEQKVIVERIDSLLGLTKNLEAQRQTTEEDLDHLDQSILAKAFRGELVPQDPNDEPAAVLLDRIRAEREQLGGGKKRGKAKA